MEFFINIVTFFITKVFPIITLGFAYVYAGVTFSSFPVFESSAKSKVLKILENHYPNAKLNYIRRSTDSGMITSYREFEISIKNNDETVVFWRIPYKDFTKENLNPTPTFDDVKAKVNRILREVNLSNRYKVIHIKNAYHTIMKKDIKNAFDLSMYDSLGANWDIKNIYMYQINTKKFLE